MNHTNFNNTEPGKGKGSAVKLSSLFKRVNSLTEQGRYDEAIDSINEAIAIFPQDARCNLELARIYQAQNKIGLAVEAMKKAIELDPLNSAHEQLLRILVELERYDEAVCLSRKLLSIFPKHLLARDVLSIVYLQKGDLDKALAITNELIRLAPLDPSHYFKKAVLLQQKGVIGEAMEAFMRTLDMSPPGELEDDTREAIAALDSYQLRQILSIVINDKVFRTKLMLNPESACRERGFILSPSGISALRQIDISSLPDESDNRYYH